MLEPALIKMEGGGRELLENEEIKEIYLGRRKNQAWNTIKSA